MARDYQAELLEIEKERLANNESIRTEGQLERDRLEAAAKEYPEHAALYGDAIAASKTQQENLVAANDKVAAAKVDQVEADQVKELESAREFALVPPPPPPGAGPESTSQTYQTSAQSGQPGPYEVDVQVPPGGGGRGPEPIEQVETANLGYSLDQRGQMFANAAGVAEQTATTGDWTVGAAVLAGAAVQQVQSYLNQNEQKLDAAVSAPQSPEQAAENQLRGEIEAADRSKPGVERSAPEAESKTPQPSSEEQNRIMEEFRTAPPPPKPEPAQAPPGNDYVI